MAAKPKRLCFLSLILIACTVYAQEVSWVQTYEVSPHGTSAFDVIHLSNRGFVVVGVATFPPENGSFQGWGMRTDLDGDIVWSRTYGTFAPETFMSVAAMNNELWVAGHNGSWPTLYRLSPAGDSLWSTTFPGWQLGRRLDRILATPDGDLLVTSDYPVLSNVDTLGNVMWSLRGPEYHNNVRALALLPEDGYVVACNTNWIWDFQDTIAIRIYWVNEEGSVLDSADFTDYRWNYAECILPISQDEVIVGGFTQPGQVFYDEYPLVFRINRAGQVAWQFVGNLGHIGRLMSGVQLVNDSIWAVSYNLHSELGARDPLLHVFDRNGHLQGQLRIDADPSGYSYDCVYAMASVDPAATIVTGSTFISGSPWKAFLALVSSTSGVDDQPGNATSPLASKKLAVSFSSGMATIRLPEQVSGELIVTVYNILGQTVYQARPIVSNSNSVTIPLNVSSGKYFITASHARQRWTGSMTVLR